MENRKYMLNGLHSHIQAQHDEMLSLLFKWCLINSGSTHLAGLNQMCDALKKAFEPLADCIEIHPSPPMSKIGLDAQTYKQSYGDCLLIRKRPHLKRRMLLCAHMDTVFSEKHIFQNVKKIDDNTLNGPGVADMKGGIVVLLYALQAFEKFDEAASLGWDILINADEELGSPSSRFLLDKIAPQYQVGLVYEPAMSPEGVFAKNRRGSGKFTLICSGRAAHAGRDFHLGRNAIVHLSRILVDIHALNDKKTGVTINIGQISGGEALNIVPKSSVAKLDVRISNPKDESWVRAQFERIIRKHEQKDYSVECIGEFIRPVKRVNVATKRLFKRLQEIGKRLHLNLEWQDSGGCCDGNNLSAHDLAVIDTLGVRGGKIHSEEEFILLDSLVERALLSTLLFLELAKGHLEEISTHRGLE
jgi:glutamate carboxypeptidase